jgi:hypothetical protein
LKKRSKKLLLAVAGLLSDKTLKIKVLDFGSAGAAVTRQPSAALLSMARLDHWLAAPGFFRVSAGFAIWTFGRPFSRTGASTHR